jgi:hypothetical protein
MRVDKNDAKKFGGLCRLGELSFERHHQKKLSVYQWATVPYSYWLRQTQLNVVDPVLIGCARLS